jgi:hypothetical protein
LPIMPQTSVTIRTLGLDCPIRFSGFSDRTVMFRKYESVLSSWTQPSYARPSDTLATGLRGLPENTPMELRAAHMNPWMWDYSLEALLKPVCEKLGEFNARAQGLVLNPMPRFLLNFGKDNNEEPSHSVMSVTAQSGSLGMIPKIGSRRYTKDGRWEIHEDAGEAVAIGWEALHGIEEENDWISCER